MEQCDYVKQDKSCKQLILLMDEERDTLDRYLDFADRLRASLGRRDWKDLEISIKSMEEITGKIGVLEERRITHVSEIGGKECIEQILLNTDSDIRLRYNRAKRELKARLLSVKARSLSIEKYADMQSRLGQEMMEGLLPSFRGKIYNGRGQAASGERNAILLSRYF